MSVPVSPPKLIFEINLESRHVFDRRTAQSGARGGEQSRRLVVGGSGLHGCGPEARKKEAHTSGKTVNVHALLYDVESPLVSPAPLSGSTGNIDRMMPILALAKGPGPGPPGALEESAVRDSAFPSRNTGAPMVP